MTPAAQAEREELLEQISDLAALRREVSGLRDLLSPGKDGTQ